MEADGLIRTLLSMLAAPSAVAATPVQDCAQIVQSVNALSATISNDGNSYWTHRKNYVELKYGQSHVSVPGAGPLADQEMSQASLLQEATRKNLLSFAALLADAQSQKCLSPAELLSVREPTFKSAKHVIIDKLPSGPHEGVVKQPPRMPTK